MKDNNGNDNVGHSVYSSEANAKAFATTVKVLKEMVKSGGVIGLGPRNKRR